MKTHPYPAVSKLLFQIDQLLTCQEPAQLQWYQPTSDQLSEIHYTAPKPARLRWYKASNKRVSISVHATPLARHTNARRLTWYTKSDSSITIQGVAASVHQLPSAAALEFRPNIPANPLHAILDRLDGKKLSPRHRQTLALLLTGSSEKQVARRLLVSQHTVHVYVKQIYRTYNVESRGELLALFIPAEAVIALSASRCKPSSFNGNAKHNVPRIVKAEEIEQFREEKRRQDVLAMKGKKPPQGARPHASARRTNLNQSERWTE